MNPLLINTPLSKEISLKNNYENYKKLTIGSGVKLWWNCSTCNNEWNASINSRNSGSGCPKCSKNKREYSNNNYLYNVNKDIFKELDKELNGNINFKNIMAGSEKEYYWLCKDFNHSFKAKVGRRAYRGYNCPYCSNKKLLTGFNDLESYSNKNNLNYLLEEYSSNNPLKANEIVYKSSSKVKWNCSNCLHEWITQVNYRSIRKTGCPKCSKRNSFGEKELRKFFENYGLELICNSRNIIKPLELDLFLPEFKIAIEFNGDYWHSEEYIKNSKNISSYKYHENKINACNDNDVSLLFIWEHDWILHKDLIISNLYNGLEKDFVNYDSIFFNRLTNSGECFLCDEKYI